MTEECHREHDWRTIHGKRVIAMLDILGFKDLVACADLARLPEILDGVIQASQRPFPCDGIVDSIVYADSILLYGMRGGRYDSLEAINLAITTSNLLHQCFSWDCIPLRGALTYGDIYIDRNRSVALGSGLVRAFELEQQQEWVGAIVDPEHEQLFATSIAIDVPEFLLRYPAPMKSGRRREYCCVGWVLKSQPSEKQLKHVILRGNEYDEPHSICRKYHNTRDFLAYCQHHYPDHFED